MTAVACFLSAVSGVARAQAEEVKVYVSNVSVSFPDPAGVDDMFSKNKDAVEVTLGFIAPKGYQFVPGDEQSEISVTDAQGVRRQVNFDSFLSSIPDSGAFAKCPLRMKNMPEFPLKLDGVIKMRLSEGIQVLPAQEFDVKKGSKFKVNGMEIVVKKATDLGNGAGELELEFKDVLNVKEIKLNNGKGVKEEAMDAIKGVADSDHTWEYTYKYIVKNMPARMKAVITVSKEARTIDVPVKMTVDLNAPSK